MRHGNPLRLALRGRGISYLMHFTRAENLPSIIENGLQPRSALEAAGAPFIFTDSWRADGFPDAISLSVSSWNWQMLSAVMKRQGGGHWVVLGLDADLIVGARCRFHPRNAASGHYASSMRRFQGLRDFDDMFAEPDFVPGYRGGSYRAEFGVPDRLPSDAQAEILHFGPIRAERILFAVAEDMRVAEFADLQINRLPGPERHVAYRSLGHQEGDFRTPFGLWPGSGLDCAPSPLPVGPSF